MKTALKLLTLCLAATLSTACGKGKVAGQVTVPCSPTALHGECPSGQQCVAGTCTEPTTDCTDRCGDGCEPCSVGEPCTSANDCASTVCNVQVCRGATCGNGTLDGDETGVDCGGSCGACGSSTCTTGSDCASGHCDPDGCRGELCANGVRDGDETDVDCGGSCNACGGAACTTADDCASGLCNADFCRDEHCNNGAQDDDETGIDCGGACGECNGTDCTAAVDCASGQCNIICESPSCVPADGIKNGTETGIDCGGPGCPTCDTGETCTVSNDCESGVCNQTCQAATCTDGVQNQDERGIDCAGACLATSQTCAAGTPCDSPTECSSGFCNGSCQASSCAPADGIENGQETDVDCGGPDCPTCPGSSGCSVNTDCSTGYCNGSGVCATVACGDGIRAGTEACDDNDTPYPTSGDDIFNGQTCATFGFTAGAIVCAPDCTLDLSHCTGGCGNGTRESTEQCDGTDLNGATCASLGYDATPGLGCTSDCAFDDSACTSSTCPTCVDGAFCSVDTSYRCTCPLYETACNSGCASLLTDPDNCGSCGRVCAAGEACSSGKCETTCPAPLVKCGRRCIDPQTDATYCGAQSGCSNAVDCVAAYSPDRICLSGSCAPASSGLDYTNAGDTATRCIGGGKPLNFNTGLGCDPEVANDPDCVVPPALGCAGDLAAVTFRYALCSCTDINTSHPLFADGFDSSTGPYSTQCENGAACSVPGSDNGQCSVDSNGDGHTTCADQRGAGIGANGTYSNSQLTTVWGSLWLSNGAPASYPDQRLADTTIEQELHVGNTLSGGTVQVRGNGYVRNNITASGTFDGTLYQSTGRTSTMSAATIDRSANPLDVPEACDCSTAKLVDVPAIVDAHACLPQGTNGCSGVACCATSNNNNADIALSPTVLAGVSQDVRIDLPCGIYDFTAISGGNNTTISIVVHGRTAIIVDSHINVPKILNVTLDASAELDVFVKGGVCNNDTIYVGTPAYPARVRFYVGGGNLLAGGSGTTCATNATRAMALKSIVGAANMYAPFGEVYMPQTFTLYGSIFAGRANIVQTATVHFDTGISHAGETCDKCGNDVVDPGEQCDGAALGGATCGELGYGNGALGCTATCTFDTRGCCGDGTRGGSEQCDGTDLGGNTCATFGQSGVLSCSPTCGFQGCTNTCTPNGILEPGNGEECDPGNPVSAADVFPSNRDTCAEVLGVAASGALACTASCRIDSTSCGYCGNGIRDNGEECDGDDFGTDGGVQSTPPACSAGNGSVTCSATCALDTSGCAGCNDCRDCNNQACVSGTCGACTDSSQCCAPFLCLAGTCTLF